MNPALPQPSVGKWPSLALAALVHVLLILFLFFGVRWQNPPPEAVEVSVVNGVPPPPPRAAAEPEPRPEPPQPAPKPEPKPEPKPQPKPEPPPPAKPEIVTKPEPKKPPEKPQPKPEPPKPQPKAEPKPAAKPAAEPDRIKELLAAEDKQRRADAAKRQADEQQRQFAEQLAAESQRLASARAGAAAKSALEGYMNKIRLAVKPKIIPPPGVSGNPEAIFLVNQAPDGTVLEVRLQRSSGNPALDTAIEKAILKSSPLPLPDNPAIFSRSLELKFRPLDD